ncbi:DUF6083 domain-containing protein [Streptomyces sp. LN785]|uniref:DUF6083 domain-containing protein n=1 Tax=Streptomyces sp. LN785 TaxID=3112983 RepID=UPI003720BF53
MASRSTQAEFSPIWHGRIAPYPPWRPARTLNTMGDNGNTTSGPDSIDNAFHALLEGATAPRPPTPPDCPFCDLPQDRYATHYEGHWVLLETHIVVPAHILPPRRRWIIASDGAAMNLWDAEPLPGTQCRIAHRSVCPYLQPEDDWPWTTVLRQENERRAQRLFSLPDDWGLPGTG